MPTRSTRPLATPLLLLLPLLLGACQPVAFYQKEAFADPVMEFESDPTEIHFHQKVYYSMEGSAGGIGASAGGGCGCY